jgi:glycosyltransferase involved in cell wall biosynthesis
MKMRRAQQRPRILILITLAEAGGAQTYVASLLPALAAEFDVVVAAHGDGALGDAARAAGVGFVALHHLRRPIAPGRDLLALVELVRLLRRERPLLLHVNSSKAGILGRLAGALAGVPVRIFTVHGWAFTAHTGAAARLYLLAERMMRPLTTQTICVAESERAAGIRARACRSDRTVVIRNGVDLQRPRRRDEHRHGPVALVSVGRLRGPKDFSTLVRAVAALPRGAMVVRIAGAGPDHAALAAEIERLGLDGTVALLGEIHDIGRLLADADVFALASRSEGLPMSIIEAMAAGLPVVASAVGGIPELVEDGRTGLLVAPGDAAAFGRALEALAGDAELRRRLGTAARRRAEREFDLAICRRAHVELYRSLLCGVRPKRSRR